MNKKFIKILSTFGLIIAIALILNGIFDIGKIGIKNFKGNSLLACSNTKNDEIIKVQLNEKDKIWTDNWGKVLETNEWNKNKIIAIEYSWTETLQSDGSVIKSPITKIDHILDRITCRLKVNYYPPNSSFFQLNFNCELAKKKF